MAEIQLPQSVFFGGQKEQRLTNECRKRKILLSIIFLKRIEDWRACPKIESEKKKTGMQF